MLKQAYAQALGIPVEIFVARDYAALIDAQATATRRLCSLFDDGLCDGGAALRMRRAGRGAGWRGWRDRHQGNSCHARRPALETLRRRAPTGSPSHGSTALPASLLPRLELAARQVALSGSEPFLVHADSASAAEACWSMVGRRDFRLAAGQCRRRASQAARCSGLEAAGIDKASLSVVWRSSCSDTARTPCVRVSTPSCAPTLVAFLTGLKEMQPGYLTISSRPHRGGGIAQVRAATM